MHIIYKHTNKLNGKIYIGQCSSTLERRERPNGSGYKKCPLFWKSIIKNGWDSFTHEIIEVVETVDEANNREKYWVAFYNTNDPKYGYNLTPGGQNCLEEMWKNEQYRARMIESFKRERAIRFNDENYKVEFINKMVSNLKAKWQDDSWRKNRIKNMFGENNSNHKAVICLETGQVFPTIKEASLWLGHKSVSGIGQCCKGIKKSCGVDKKTGEKLHWAYYNNN